MNAITALAICALLAASACASQDVGAQRLRENLRNMRSTGRLLKQTAISRATGGQTASASAVAGPGFAATDQAATGAGAQVLGVSEVGGKVEACQQGPANSAACQTLTTADRATACTNIPPDTEFTCEEQAGFGKCDADFIYLDAYCLQSCNRCGENCADTPPPNGGGCAADQCNATEVTAGPYCLRTCNRCHAAA